MTSDEARKAVEDAIRAATSTMTDGAQDAVVSEIMDKVDEYASERYTDGAYMQSFYDAQG